MSIRLLLNLLLLVVAGGLALFIYLGTGKDSGTDQYSVSSIDPDTVSAIQLVRVQGETLDFIRRDGQWFIAGSPEQPADDFQVGTLLALVNAETDRHYPASTLDLKTMGLLPPQATLLLDDERFDIGSTNPLDRLRYVRHGDTVYLVMDRYQHLLNARRSNFIDRRLLPPDAVVTGLTLPGLSLRLDADNHWALQPADPAVSATAIRTLVSAWENARALYVREHTGYGGEPVNLWLKAASEPLKFTLHTEGTDIILARPDRGIQYHLSEASGRQLLEFTSEQNNQL